MEEHKEETISEQSRHPQTKTKTLHKKAHPLIKAAKKLFNVRDLKSTGIFWLDVALNIIMIVALVVIIRTFIISPFQVYGPSMCDTLNNVDGTCQRAYGEYLIVNKLGYQNIFGWKIGVPKRGDIIVFHPPMNNNEFFIKRIIGLPGETVQLKDGKVYVFNQEKPEGFELKEDYLNSINSGNTNPFNRNNTVFEVPKDSYFVMGDNRTASSDSRSCFQETASNEPCKGEGKSPFLTMDHIEGKAWLVLWPLNKISALKDPTY
jgi:signal peptidase I